MAGNMLAACAVLLLLFGILSQAHPNSDGGHVLQLKNIGGADGKFYFLEVSSTMTFTQAEDYCQQDNFQFATIETAAQGRVVYDGLVSEYGNQNPWVWVNAKERETAVHNLVWESTRAELNSNAFSGGLNQRTYPGSNCGAVDKGNDGLRAVYRDCGSRHYVLCQVSM